jgi:hypothetical protein
MRYANYTYEHAPSKFIMISKTLIFFVTWNCARTFDVAALLNQLGLLLDSFAHYFKQFIKPAHSVILYDFVGLWGVAACIYIYFILRCQYI